MATIIQVGTAGMGGGIAPAQVLRTFVMPDVGLQRFRQFAELPPGYQLEYGKVAVIPKWGDFANVGAAVAETATIPIGTATMGTATVTIGEYGQGIDSSRLAIMVANQSIEQIMRTIIDRDARKGLEQAAEAAFDLCNRRYVATATNAGSWTTNGTATATQTSALNKYHLGVIRDYMKATLKVPSYDEQGNYVAIMTVKAHRNIQDDASIEAGRMYADPGSLLSGEIGRYDGFRFVEDSDCANFSNAIGQGSLTGEAYFFGDTPIVELPKLPEHVVQDAPSDFGRRLALAWYYLGGFGGSGLDHIVKWDSHSV